MNEFTLTLSPKGLALVAAAAAAVLSVVLLGSRPAAAETIYVVNHAPQYISDKTIKNDIPAWEKAANQDFAAYWRTPQIKIELVKRVPDGGIGASFVKDGPVQGALAYHTVTRGVPQMVIYAGVADFYGYSNSVSFTHELFEMLADPTITVTNQGYPYPNFCLLGNVEQCFAQTPGTIWAQEVADPVEAQSYGLPGADGKPVPISDFVTPNWFNDQVRGAFDYMDDLTTPFQVMPGGYAQFWDGLQWNLVGNFRHLTGDPRGFLLGEKHARLVVEKSARR